MGKKLCNDFIFGVIMDAAIPVVLPCTFFLFFFPMNTFCKGKHFFVYLLGIFYFLSTKWSFFLFFQYHYGTSPHNFIIHSILLYCSVLGLSG